IPIPALDDVLEAWGLSLNGYLDVSYSYLSTSGKFAPPPATPASLNSRVSDFQHNSFSVHQAAFTLAKQPKEGFGALVNLTAGEDADVIHSFGSGFGTTTNFDVTQAFAQYAKGPFTAIGGKYVTLAGAEVINPTQDTNFSRSILFGFAIPFTHTGVRGTYAVSDTLSFILGVNNGWDQLQDANSSKTAEVGVSYAPLKNLSIAAQGYFGREPVTAPLPSTQQGFRSLVDVVATYTATDKLTLILNGDWGAQKNTAGSGLVTTGNNTARWYGLAAYGIYQFTDQWRGSLRAEYFGDKDGYRTGVAQDWKEVTLTLAYLPTKNIELRGEVRADRSNGTLSTGGPVSGAFVKTNGSLSKNQTSVGLEALFKF
ncbi:MAG TPA: outer membrane beta-barrel protein, partial [Burkholderiales bacterium]|nr:outer membrane beta-barrel protein [Burkholderiales bacterium]